MRRAFFARALTSLLLAVMWPGAGPAGAQESSEYAVKAAYLYKFAPFVEWPPTAFASPSSPIALCIVGDDPFGTTLDRLAAGQSVSPRPIEIRRLRTARSDEACHIMFIADTGVQTTDQALNTVRGRPILTAADFDPEARTQPIITFVVENRRVRFDIDDDAAAENGITISSKLLSLARSVKPRRKG